MVYKKVKQRYPGLINRRLAVFQQDNAKRNKSKVQELEGIELLPHLLFSPGAAPSDYGLSDSYAS